MLVTYIGLREYFQRCIPKAKKQKYVLILALIARYADAQELYDKLETDWASLNDLTNNKILFVFSTPKVRKRASFFHLPGKPSYEGVMCPFVELLNGRGVEDNNGPFEFLYHEYDNINWKQKHSQTITQFASAYNISEKEIPCLFLYDLKKDRYKVIPVCESTDIYAVIKSFINEISEYGKRQQDVESQLEKYKNIDAYYRLYEELEDEARGGDSKQSVVISKVLHEEQPFKAVKLDISSPKIRRDLKRIGQWKRHYLIPFEKDDVTKKRYYELKKKRQNIENEFDSVWTNLGSAIQESKKETVSKEVILYDLLAGCAKLQSNSMYFSATEDCRNDYIRDMLKTAGYDVKDQTRRGISSSGKGVGEVDILVEEDGLPVTIVEALNLDCVNTSYLDMHIDKIYGYDMVGNMFNIILSYVSVSNFSEFCEKYFEHIKEHQYPYPLISADNSFMVEEFPYSDIRVMKTVHNRNNCDTVLYHVCMLIR